MSDAEHDYVHVRYAETSSKTTHRMQLVDIEGRKTGRKLTRLIINDYTQGLPSAINGLIFLN